MIQVTINGELRSIPAGKSVLELLEFLATPADRVAVEINREIVCKRDWGATTIEAGAKIEIVQFVGGG